MMTNKDFQKKLRKHIESLGEIIGYLKDKKEDFIVRKLQSIQGFLAYLEKVSLQLEEDEQC